MLALTQRQARGLETLAQETVLKRRSGGIVGAVAGYSTESAARLLIAAAVGIFVARYLGPSGFGLLAYGLSIFGLLGSLTTFGMRSILVREFSTARQDWRVVLASALTRQIPVALAMSVISSLVIMATRGFEREPTLIAVALLPLPLLALSDNFRALHESSGRVRVVAITGIAATSLAALLKAIAILTGSPIWHFAVITTVESIIMFAGFLWAVPGHKSFSGLRRLHNRAVASSLVRESWPLMLAALAVTIYMRIDIVMLGILSGDSTVGIYSAAARLSEVWYFIPVAAMAAIRPRLARIHAGGDKVRYGEATQRFMSAAFGSAVIIVAGILVVGQRLITLLYGTAFNDAGLVLRIHVLAAPFVFLGVASSQWFIDRGLTKAVLARSVAGAVTNVLLNLILIPLYGAVGAAISTVVSYAVSGMLMNATERRTRPLFWMQAKALFMAELSRPRFRP